MFMKKKFILGVLYFGAANAQGKLQHDAIDYLNYGAADAEQTELREFESYDGGMAVIVPVMDPEPIDAATGAVNDTRHFVFTYDARYL
jgi:hypothetical protein